MTVQRGGYDLLQEPAQYYVYNFNTTDTLVHAGRCIVEGIFVTRQVPGAFFYFKDQAIAAGPSTNYTIRVASPEMLNSSDVVTEHEGNNGKYIQFGVNGVVFENGLAIDNNNAASGFVLFWRPIKG